MMNKEINNELKKIILKNIKRNRAINGICEHYIGVKLGISQSQYCKIESGQTKNLYKYLDHIAAILEVSPLELATPRDDNKKEKKESSATNDSNNPSKIVANKDLKNIESYIDFMMATNTKHLNDLFALKIELGTEQNQRIADEISKKELETKLAMMMINKQTGGGGG